MRFLLCLIFLLPSYFSYSENLPTSGTLLWRVSGNGLNESSYLYGTMHTRDKRAFHFSDSVLICFMKCKQFAMELKLDEINREEVLSNMMLDSGQTIENYLSASQYDSLQNKIESSTGLPATLFSRMKPIYIATLLSEGDLLTDSSAQNSNLFFLDEYFQMLAKNSGMKVNALEQLQTQLNVFNVLSLSQQIDFLMKSIRDEEQSEKPDTFIHHYVNGELEILLGANDEMGVWSKEFVSRILYQRNSGMANEIERMAKQHGTFAAFGAAHLTGDSGVISLLRTKGYKVEPIDASYNDESEEGWKYVYPCNTISFAMPGLPLANWDSVSITLTGIHKVVYQKWSSKQQNEYCVVRFQQAGRKSFLKEVVIKETGTQNFRLSKTKNLFTKRKDMRTFKINSNDGYVFEIENGNEEAVAMVMSREEINEAELKRFLSLIRLKVSSVIAY